MEKSAAHKIKACEPRTGGPAWHAAEAEGHDMSLIVENLTQPVWDRLPTHQSALGFALMLREAGAKLRGGSH